MPSSDDLRAKQDGVLIHLAEECSEVIQCSTKAIRFGIDSLNPYEPDTGSNRERISEEIGHVLALIERATGLGLIDPMFVHEARKRKLESFSND